MVAVLLAVLMVPLLAMVAFSIDYGFLLKVETDLQRCADAASLAAVQDLVPANDGSQDLAVVRAAVRQYVTTNYGSAFTVLDSDIEIGRYDPNTIYTNLTLLNTGIFDTVRVTVRRDAQANSQVPLFFARVLGISNMPVTATAAAVLQKGVALDPGALVLPFSIPVEVWDSQGPGDQWHIYSDGSLVDEAGETIPGNWGTLDIGSTSNSTNDLRDQILDGLRQTDLDYLYADGRIPQDSHIDADEPLWMNGDPGISTGIKLAVEQIHGQERLIPIYDTLIPNPGANLEFHVIGWAVVTVVDSRWNGAKNTRVTIEKSYTYMGDLRPNESLGSTTGNIEGAYTSPVLVD